MEKIVFLLFFVCTFVFSSFAQHGSDCELLLSSANSEYNRGNYEKASELYKKLQSKCGDYGGCAAKLSDCNQKLREDEAYKRCSTIEACDSYLKTYPNGRYASAVRQKRNALVDAQKKSKESEISVLDYELWNVYLKKCSEYVTESHSNGSYKGQVRNGDQDGLGMYAWENGSLYIGEWSSGKMDGYGVYICGEKGTLSNYPGCKYYCGNFSNGVISGVGKCYDELGKCIYVGFFDKGMPVYGFAVNGDTNHYKLSSLCQFKCLEDKDALYVGETRNGEKQGRGIDFLKNGDLLYAEWNSGARDGYDLYLDYSGGTHTEAPIANDLKMFNISFDADDVVPIISECEILVKSAMKIRSNSILCLVVICYVPASGDEEYNRDLTRRRANSIYHILVEKLGIDPSQIELHTYLASDEENDNITQEDISRTAVISLKVRR